MRKLKVYLDTSVVSYLHQLDAPERMKICSSTRRPCCWKEMMRTMTKPIVSKAFNLEDIRKIREYNSLRHVQMTPKEIIEDTRQGAAMVLEQLRKK